MYVRRPTVLGLGAKWYETALDIIGEAGAAVVENQYGKQAGAAVRGIHKGWTTAAFGPKQNEAQKPAGGPQPAPQPPAPPPQYPVQPYPSYPPPTQPNPARMAAGAAKPTRAGISPLVLVIGGVGVLGVAALLLTGRRRERWEP
jgi:hypothetical protein